MDPISRISIALAFLGLLTLIVGYSRRDAGYGPVLVWAGVAMMIGVVVHHVLRTLSV